MAATSDKLECRHCKAPLDLSFADLGATPISNEFIYPEQLSGPEIFYPLKTYVCRKCRLVQLQDFFKSPDLFRPNYAYFSSISSSWLDHCRRYADRMASRFSLGANSHVVELASNDGYLLQYFKAKGIPVLGIEPSLSVAEVAIKERGIPTEVRFFGRQTAQELAANGKMADLIAANNVLAHVPDINDFVAGVKILLKPEGIATFEFPHLLNLIRFNQFDTIYHEHFSYLSLLASESIFGAAGLRVFDVDQIPTHGGSIRLYVCHGDAKHSEQAGLKAVRDLEAAAKLDADDIYIAYAEQVRATKRDLLSLLISLKRDGKTIVGYGAPAKGNTLLNYCGIGADILEYTVDRSPHKQGLFLPGTRLPIKAPEAIQETKPDYVLILPWNLKSEIIEQMQGIREWGGAFIIPIPTAEVIA